VYFLLGIPYLLNDAQVQVVVRANPADPAIVSPPPSRFCPWPNAWPIACGSILVIARRDRRIRVPLSAFLFSTLSA